MGTSTHSLLQPHSAKLWQAGISAEPPALCYHKPLQKCHLQTHQRYSTIRLFALAPSVSRTRQHQLQGTRQRRAGFRCQAASAATGGRVAVAERLSGSDLEQWNACVAKVVGLGLEEEQAERTLAKAFGWAGGVYWGAEKKEEPPNLAQVEAVEAYLDGLGIRGADFAKLVKVFPELLGCDVEGQIAGSVAYLQKNYKMKGTVLANTIKRRPQILGYTIDCEGDCAGVCNRCWVRF